VSESGVKVTVSNTVFCPRHCLTIRVAGVCEKVKRFSEEVATMCRSLVVIGHNDRYDFGWAKYVARSEES
jgi:hypothetical protein